MAYIFGDSYDLYATIGDCLVGYWDTGTVGTAALAAGRFTGSQTLQMAGTPCNFTKSSNVNDVVHHLVVAFRQTAVLSGATLGGYLQLLDGVTGQCCVVFRQDGAILLTSGTPGGTILDTYTGAVIAANTWTAFEIEIVINNTTGSWAVRKNGNTSNDHALGSLNTRVSANNYANKLTIGMNGTVNATHMDDLLWRSDAASVPWVGDIRCYARMPASDASVQFSRSPASVTVAQNVAASGTVSKAANAGLMSAFTATYSGTIATGTISVSTGGTGNMKAAIYDATRTTVLATSNAVVNPVTGSNAITFGTPAAVTRGVTYYLAVDQDFTVVYNAANSSASNSSFTTTYASFPAASPALTTPSQGTACTVNITPTVSAEFVNETLQDGTTSYVYDATVGHNDFYNIAAIASTPVATIAVTTRGFTEKSDAGTRTAAVQLKSGGATVAAPTLTLSTSWLWVWRTDLTDPNTGAAWTPAAVNNAQIGPTVVS